MAIVTDRIAQNLRRLRAQLGWTQAEFAEKLGAKQTSYSNWERGTALPDKDVWDRIAEVTGKDVAFFVLDSSEPVEIVKTKEVEGFRALAKMLAEIGRNGGDVIPRIGSDRTRKRALHHAFVSKSRMAFG